MTFSSSINISGYGGYALTGLVLALGEQVWDGFYSIGVFCSFVRVGRSAGRRKKERKRREGREGVVCTTTIPGKD